MRKVIVLSRTIIQSTSRCWEWSKLVAHPPPPPPPPRESWCQPNWEPLAWAEGQWSLQWATYIGMIYYIKVSYKLHACPACLALWNWTSLTCLVLAGMACNMQLYNCMYCTCMDKPTKLNSLLGVSILQEYISSSHQTFTQNFYRLFQQLQWWFYFL